MVRRRWPQPDGRGARPATPANRSGEAQARAGRAGGTRRRRARRAASEWEAAQPAPDSHPYLARKGVRAHGLRVDADGRLLVPVRNGSELHSLQYINADGDKRFLPGGRVSGGCYAFGKAGETVCIAEGFATAATINEATGYPVAVAFNCGNLEAVARAVRDKLPRARLILCADDDARTDGNPGLTKATDAARAVGGLLAVPDFGADRPEGATDFNDLAKHRGADAVQACIASARTAGRRGVARSAAVGGGLRQRSHDPVDALRRCDWRCECERWRHLCSVRSALAAVFRTARRSLDSGARAGERQAGCRTLKAR